MWEGFMITASSILIYLIIAMLIFCSMLDLKVGKVKRRYSFVVLLLSITFWFYNEPTWLSMSVIVAMILGMAILGNLYINDKLFGGADIQITIALAPVLYVMGLFGGLFIAWLYVLVPALSYLSAKLSKQTNSELFKTFKIRFIPIITLVFIALLIAWQRSI